MGCSVSCSLTPYPFTITTTTTKHLNPPSTSYNSSPSPRHFCSPFSDHCYNSSSTQTPVSRTMSMPTPLIHHPPLCKGDSNHFVHLTFTTYGSPITTAMAAGITTTTDTTKTLEQYPVSDPDSVVNTWELMEGLDEDEFDTITACYDPKKPNSYNQKIISESIEKIENVETKPLWKHLFEESMLLKSDSNLVSSCNKALSSRDLGGNELKIATRSITKERGLKGDFYSVSGYEDRIVLYYTSLRGIRKTFEDCYEVRLILKGFRVFVDERDVSMDSSYRNEVQSLFEGKGFTLPQVFIRGKHIGGADEIKRLHEEGKLYSFMKGFPVIDPGFVCDHCGDVRFVPCPNCDGSRKVFVEAEGRSIRCVCCNENGLIKCATCCS